MPNAKHLELSINQLQTFQLVMEKGGYAAAAKHSHLSVPSMWQHIQAIERAYGVELFSKEGRRVSPTPAAEQLYEHISSILEQLESTYQVLHQHGEQSIRLVTGARMMLEDLAGPLSHFRSQHANQLTIRQGNDRQAQQLILDGEVDLALSLEPNLSNRSPLIHYEPAYTVEFLAVAFPNHPFMQSTSGTLAELSKHPLVVTTPGTHGREALDQAFQREDLSAQIAAQTDNSAFTIACVAAGMGVGILAGRADGELCREKKLVTKSLSQHLGQRRIFLLWREGKILSQAQTDLINSIKKLHKH